MLYIIEAKYLSDYKIEVLFNNGEKGIADLNYVLTGKMFEPLKEKTMFAQLKVDDELETIVWPNGADLAPEFIYYQVFKNDPKLQAQFKKWGYIA